MIVVIDCGVGNVHSMANMIDYIGFECVISDSSDAIAQATHLILPGVGAFDRAMKEIGSRGLQRPLESAVFGRGVPILGVCLGMQLFAETSDEGGLSGFGWIKGRVRALRSMVPPDTRVPHMGWSVARPRGPSTLFPAGQQDRFYFVHSYAMDCENHEDISATVFHGAEFCCSVQRANVYGVQFHPEKSHRFGMRVLREFLNVRERSRE